MVAEHQHSAARSRDLSVGGLCVQRLTSWTEISARVLALAGGTVLCGIVLLIGVSAITRKLGSPIEGDFELVELIIGPCVFSFFPYGQWTHSNFKVELILSAVGPRKRKAMHVFNEAMFAFVAGILTWRLIVGTINAFHANEETMALAISLGWGYFCVSLFAVVLTMTSFIQTCLTIVRRA